MILKTSWMMPIPGHGKSEGQIRKDEMKINVKQDTCVCVCVGVL